MSGGTDGSKLSGGTDGAESSGGTDGTVLVYMVESFLVLQMVYSC